MGNFYGGNMFKNYVNAQIKFGTNQDKTPSARLSSLRQEHTNFELNYYLELPNDTKAIREAIAPQVEVAQSVITSVNSAFADKCDDEKRYKQVKAQIKNWEKTLRGSCQQIVAVVNQKGFTPDPTNSSPIAFSTISDSSSRDVSVLDLAAAIITFYNSLGA